LKQDRKGFSSFYKGITNPLFFNEKEPPFLINDRLSKLNILTCSTESPPRLSLQACGLLSNLLLLLEITSVMKCSNCGFYKTRCEPKYKTVKVPQTISYRIRVGAVGLFWGFWIGALVGIGCEAILKLADIPHSEIPFVLWIAISVLFPILIARYWTEEEEVSSGSSWKCDHCGYTWD
jgi:hypothetical protein